MELIVKVEESKAKKLVDFLETLDYVQVKKSTSKRSDRKPHYEYFRACPEWQPDADKLRKLSTRKKSEW